MAKGSDRANLGGQIGQSSEKIGRDWATMGKRNKDNWKSKYELIKWTKLGSERLLAAANCDREKVETQNSYQPP